MAAKGWAAPEVERAYGRARDLCQQVGETPQLFLVLWGLWAFYVVRGKLQTARELAEQCLRLAQGVQDPTFLVGAHYALGVLLIWLGEFPSARAHLEQGIAFYDLQQHRSYASLYGWDLGTGCLWYVAWPLWVLGYPDQALQRIHEALTLARELAHPDSLDWAFVGAAFVHQFRREGRLTQERAEAALALASEQGFALQLTRGTVMRGWALAEQGQGEEGITQLQEGLVTWQALSAELGRPSDLALLAEAYWKVGQIEKGLATVTEALAVVDKTGERFYEAELYRLKGELTLQQFQVSSSKFQVQESPRSEVRSPESEAEACFLKAIEITRRQQAKSWELRAVMSLARLWQQQDKKTEARQMLAEIYNWFTEGFDTADLQEAKALLDSLQ
jgi:predicted ATPase